MHNQHCVLYQKRFISNIFLVVSKYKATLSFHRNKKKQKSLYPSTRIHKPKKKKKYRKEEKNLHAIYTKRLIFRSKLFHFSRTRGTTLVSVDRSSKLDGNERLGRMEFELKEREKKKKKFTSPNVDRDVESTCRETMRWRFVYNS